MKLRLRAALPLAPWNSFKETIPFAFFCVYVLGRRAVLLLPFLRDVDAVRIAHMGCVGGVRGACARGRFYVMYVHLV